MFPWLVYLDDQPSEDDDLSKIILQAEFDGRLKSDEGFLSAAGDLATLTAASGKDLYLTNAKISIFINTDAVTEAVANEVVLKVNGTIVETSSSSIGQTGSGGGTSYVIYNFENLFHKVAATQVLKLEVITLDAQTDVEGFIQAIEVPTGENPATYTGS